MLKKYQDYIDENVKETYGKCAEVTLEMQKQFPELERFRGHYDCPIWGKRTHWWLFDKNNEEIVDPTAFQFPSKGIGEYLALDENCKEPTRICYNCGKEIYDRKYFCSDKCAEEDKEFTMGKR